MLVDPHCWFFKANVKNVDRFENQPTIDTNVLPETFLDSSQVNVDIRTFLNNDVSNVFV